MILQLQLVITCLDYLLHTSVEFCGYLSLLLTSHQCGILWLLVFTTCFVPMWNSVVTCFYYLIYTNVELCGYLSYYFLHTNVELCGYLLYYLLHTRVVLQRNVQVLPRWISLSTLFK